MGLQSYRFGGNPVGTLDGDKPRRCIIGTVFDTYILLEHDDRLLLCDQHAIHERLLYEKLIKETEALLEWLKTK